jgi:hypothetical protein
VRAGVWVGEGRTRSGRWGADVTALKPGSKPGPPSMQTTVSPRSASNDESGPHTAGLVLPSTATGQQLLEHEDSMQQRCNAARVIIIAKRPAQGMPDGRQHAARQHATGTQP